MIAKDFSLQTFPRDLEDENEQRRQSHVLQCGYRPPPRDAPRRGKNNISDFILSPFELAG
jgi:hypothetical protein